MNRKLIGIFVSGMLLGTFAIASVDLSGEITGATKIKITKTKSIYSQITFGLKLKNTGDEAFSGDLSVKPLMIADNAETMGSLEQKGVTLDTQKYQNLNIAAGETIEVIYQSILPKVSKNGYSLSVFINNTDLVGESDTLNNLTDLVKMGTVEVLSAPANEGKFNITASFDGELDPTEGGIGDSLRTIIHGDSDAFPGEGGDDTDLWARFLLIDRAAGKVHTAPYVRYGGEAVATCKGYQVDKGWFAIGYSSEYDADGNPIYIDYYYQSPCFEDLNPGNYLFVEIINSRDLVKESDFHDNLNILPVEIKAINIEKSNTEIWFASEDLTQVLSQDVNIHASYAKSVNWNLNIEENLGLTANKTSGILGNFSGSQYGEWINLSWLPQSKKRKQIANLNFTFSPYSEYGINVPVRFYQYEVGKAPVLNVGTLPSISLGQIPMVHHVSFEFTNTGVSDLDWKILSTSSFVKLNVSEGSLVPGGKQVIDVEVDGHRVDRWYSESIIFNLLNSSLDSKHEIEINFE